MGFSICALREPAKAAEKTIAPIAAHRTSVRLHLTAVSSPGIVRYGASSTVSTVAE